jgi:hypothetical protein
MAQIGKSPENMKSMPLFFLKSIFTPENSGGFLCAVFLAIFWMDALSRYELNFAYPFMGLAIVLVMILRTYVFG